MLNSLLDQLRSLYGLDDEMKKGRSIAALSGVITAFYNVFITGIFYTGFMTMYEIDLTGVSIISFINPLANSFAIFSPLILERIKKRKWILAASKLGYYFLTVVAMTLMPLVVHGNSARVACFTLLSFAAHAMYALFSAGYTPWFASFLPEDRQARAAHFSYKQITANVMHGVTIFTAGLIVNSLRGSAQNSFILAMRYIAFAFVFLDVVIQSCAKEFPYPVRKEKIRLKEVFTLSYKYDKFFRCLLLMFVWNFVANLNSAQWNYYLLNGVKLPYSTITTVSSLYPIILLLCNPIWRRALNRLSWVRTFAIGLIIWSPSELYFFFLSPATKWMYAPGVIFQNILSVGINLGYANIFHMNLPEENAATHTCFQAFMCNICAFLGMMAGTLLCSAIGDRTFYIGKILITNVQWTVFTRFVTMLAMGLWLMRNWRMFTPDDEIEAVEIMDKHLSRRPRKTA